MKVGSKICMAMLLLLIYGCKNTSTEKTTTVEKIEKSKGTTAEVKGATLKDLRSADAVAMMKEFPANTVVLDVRTPNEISKGKIENALEIDFKGKNFKEKVSELDKSKIYLVHCKSGGRSSKAIDIMRSVGITQCYNVEEGYETFNKTLESSN